jgi:DNA-directed RNA polymerase
MVIKDKYTSLAPYSTRQKPMIVPPREWRSASEGGYYALQSYIMRTKGCQMQKDALENAPMDTALEGLNVLGRVPWKIQRFVLGVAQSCWDNGVVIGDIPSRVDHKVPQVPVRPESISSEMFKDKESEEFQRQREEYFAYREKLNKHSRLHQKNMDLRSLRCSTLLKLNQAEKFKDFDKIYFPYSFDFRGRAYPIPPHLSTVGSDLCRGLLTFSESKPLGERGLYWLKVHLANLAGKDKMSFDERAQFTDNLMDVIRASATNPMGDDEMSSWWKSCEDPFQALSTCQEITNAIDSGDPTNYMSSLPVHMDGSCNGLQHYAALGRDTVGGRAVNLLDTDLPQDVYSGVMVEVIRRVSDEAAITREEYDDMTKDDKAALKRNKAAKLMDGLIDRGVVKRTVMTSVYGVTYIGARKQIQEKIEEKLEEQGHDIDELNSEIHEAAAYLATVTMDVMNDLFTGARQTMNWLTTCARIITSHNHPVAWISPVGIPIVQPYRRSKSHTIVTLLQSMVLTSKSDNLPIHKQRQVTAFPPNYVHSLDSCHMLLTALEMEKRGLTFSAVHDSFWTHACDVDEMNMVLRETFVELYDKPLLEELKRTWELRYPGVDFPDLPERGDLDLEEVKNATYFFQ